jgi:hypothetical protein
MKTTTWICDSCGSEIEDVAHGWVEWLTKYEDGKRSSRGLRLVHHCVYSPREGRHKCQYDGNYEYQKDGHTISDTDLKSCLGSNGLMDLLSMLSDDEAPKDDIIEMIKRLHIPGYEHARFHFQAAINDGAFDPNTKPGFYPLRDIEATLAWAKEYENEE